jgi:hypothetical protein
VLDWRMGCAYLYEEGAGGVEEDWLEG